jgi:hypothetical protein
MLTIWLRQATNTVTGLFFGNTAPCVSLGLALGTAIAPPWRLTVRQLFIRSQH